MKIKTKQLKVDLNKVEYNGHSFKLIVKDENLLIKKLLRIRNKIIKKLNKK